MLGWLIFLAYCGIGCFAAVHVGALVNAREQEKFVPKHRQYPTIYEDIDLTLVYVAVFLTILCWPAMWPTWWIVSAVRKAEHEPTDARTRERIG